MYSVIASSRACKRIGPSWSWRKACRHNFEHALTPLTLRTVTVPFAPATVVNLHTFFGRGHIDGFSFRSCLYLLVFAHCGAQTSNRRWFAGKRVVELGAGLGLCGVLASKLCVGGTVSLYRFMAAPHVGEITNPHLMV